MATLPIEEDAKTLRRLRRAARKDSDRTRATLAIHDRVTARFRRARDWGIVGRLDARRPALVLDDAAARAREAIAQYRCEHKGERE